MLRRCRRDEEQLRPSHTALALRRAHADRGSDAASLVEAANGDEGNFEDSGKLTDVRWKHFQLSSACKRLDWSS
jgi:hypothetical protein